MNGRVDWAFLFAILIVSASLGCWKEAGMHPAVALKNLDCTTASCVYDIDNLSDLTVYRAQAPAVHFKTTARTPTPFRIMVNPDNCMSSHINPYCPRDPFTSYIDGKGSDDTKTIDAQLAPASEFPIGAICYYKLSVHKKGQWADPIVIVK